MENKEFYSITKGQLLVMWVFGVIGTIFCIATASDMGDSLFGFLGIALAFFLFFYTFGWRANRKNINKSN